MTSATITTTQNVAFQTCHSRVSLSFTIRLLLTQRQDLCTEQAQIFARHPAPRIQPGV